MPSDDSLFRIPRLLRGVLLLGLLGVGAELLLIEHTGDIDQGLPLIALGLGLLTLVWHGRRPRPSARRLFTLVMLGMAACGAYGVYLHYESNAEFQLDLDPQLSGWSLFAAAMRAKSPPALAPASLVPLALVGLVSTCGRKARP